MTKGPFDDLARTLATSTPMPRRHALRKIGAALALAAFRAVRPARAEGVAPIKAACPADLVSCTPPYTACCVAIKFGWHSGGCCGPGRSECCVGMNMDAARPNMMSWCCAEGTCGEAGLCTKACPADTFACGKLCCKKARPTLPQEVCYEGRCQPMCPEKTVKCGNTCCKAGEGCQNGKCCEKCGAGGPCCPATKFCCAENPSSPGRCCDKKTDSCCPVGVEGSTTRMCCAEPNACLKQLPAGTGGLTASSPRVCCPPPRQVPAGPGERMNACCAPGQVSLQGKLIVGAGIQGQCCDEEKICGKGAALTCCQTGQMCIGGTTCA